MDAYLEAYKRLNPEQKKAVDTIEGPVMVIAGPGTGKTQILALRIANIRIKTDIPADGILCLTFTNAGVKAMRERLLRYISSEANRVRVATFHSFGLWLIERFYSSLGFNAIPTLLDDATSVALLDELYIRNNWEYLRPRANPTMYFRDLKSLISVLKRDRITAEDFKASIQKEIQRLENDPDSISSRGETKGQMKKDVEKKIEGLHRSLEVSDFYALYESVKKERNIIDYNDVLELMVLLVEESDEARDFIREQFQYILIDEHQDSSAVQNEFLRKVWADIEAPNIFVVGDDRQLIYGFGGASLAHFEGFKETFKGGKLVTLTTNYRSTQTILDSAEALLKSALADGKLISSTEGAHPLELIEADYPRDEIIAAGLEIQKRIKEGVSIDACAVLMPKNRQVKASMQILKDMGLKVAAESTLKLFELPDTELLLDVLHIVNDPYSSVPIGRTLLSAESKVPVLEAHTFLHSRKSRSISVSDLAEAKENSISEWGNKLSKWLADAQTNDVYALVQIIGSELLLDGATDDEVVRKRVEVIRTMLNLVSSFIERGESVSLPNFLTFIDRLREYDEDIPLAIFAADRGVKVLTLHGSKGLEFDFVWIAHMDEKSLMGSKRQAFVLPEDIGETVQEHVEEVAKRQLYVAITRAKRYCSISYSRYSHTGADHQLAGIIAALPNEIFEKKSASETEEKILNANPKQYVSKEHHDRDTLEDLIYIVSKEYAQRHVSVTMLNNFFECTWKWYFRNLLQLPEPENESLHLGNVVHKNIEYALKHEGASIEELKIQIATCAAIEARHNENLANRLATQALPIIESWLSIHATKLAKPFEIEKPLTYHDPGISEIVLFGKIDVVERVSNGSVRVTDWKTGQPKTKSDIDKRDDEGRMSPYMRQLAMYAYLIEGTTNGGDSVDEARLVFVEGGNEKNAIVSRKITTDDILALRQDIKDYKKMVESGEWVHRSCCVKKYGHDDKCEYCTMAERFGNIKPIK